MNPSIRRRSAPFIVGIAAMAALLVPVDPASATRGLEDFAVSVLAPDHRSEVETLRQALAERGIEQSGIEMFTLLTEDGPTTIISRTPEEFVVSALGGGLYGVTRIEAALPSAALPSSGGMRVQSAGAEWTRSNADCDIYSTEAFSRTITGCGGDGGVESPVPTEDQARAAFETKFEQAQAGDPETFCGDTEIPDMCRSQWERLGGAGAIPKEKPRVASVREQDGYRVVRVCGQDGQGHAYRSDFVVGLEDDGELSYALPVFWNGATFSGVHGDDTGNVDAAQPAAEPSDCA